MKLINSSIIAITLISCASVKNDKPAIKASVQLGASGREITTKIENGTASWLVLQKWNTPFDRHYPRGGVFEITDRTGKLMPYSGRYISQVGFDPDDFLLIEPHGFAAQARRLDDGYRVPTSRPYTVRYNAVVTYGAFATKSAAEQAVTGAVKNSDTGKIVKVLSLISNQVTWP